MTTEEKFYIELWNETEEAFYNAPIKSKLDNYDELSHFAVCARPCPARRYSCGALQVWQ